LSEPEVICGLYQKMDDSVANQEKLAVSKKGAPLAARLFSIQ
jgi:hypothetical protein